MAKASTKTTVYELKSRPSGETLFVTERAVFKYQKIAGSVIRTPLRPQINDKTGRSFERLSGMLMRCLQSGEVFQIVEQAPSIRREPL
jgi:hypothetical protein